jgi:hypothetical protein
MPNAVGNEGGQWLVEFEQKNCPKFDVDHLETGE